MNVSFRRTALLAALIISAATPAAQARGMAGQDSFSRSEALSDNELAGLRGGFISVGGLTIDFALNTRVLVDGVTQSSFTINSSSLDDLLPENLQRIVTVGQNNTNEALDELMRDPSVLTVIQNSEDNRVIQTFNQLDVTVSNTESFIQAHTTQGMDFQQVNALK